jgi:thioredoxin reductase (NADPH)
MKILFLLLTITASLFGAPAQETYPVIILGGGVGALTSSLYLSRAGIAPVIIEGRQPGGLITQSHLVQNWPGEMEIKGSELAAKLKKQVEDNGALLLAEEVIRVDFSKRPFQVVIRDLSNGKERTLFTESVIIAMGTTPNHLGVKGETGADGYWGRGVTNCATCDGALYRDQVVGVVGGGDSAILEALYLSNIAKEVNIFVRKENFKSIEGKRLEELLARPNVKVFYHTSVQEIRGDGSQLKGVLLQKEGEAPYELAIDGLFLAIGSTPNTKIFEGILPLDARGYIVLQKDQETPIPGVYAIGDIVDPVYKQAISAAGDGAKAAMQAQLYLDRIETVQKAIVSSHQKEKKMAVASRVIEVGSIEQFKKEVESSTVPVVVDFYAVWCGPCKQLAPLFDRSAATLGKNYKFLKVNVETVKELSHQYRIRSMPTVLVFNSKGAEVERQVGTDQIASLLQRLEDTYATHHVPSSGGA